MVSMDDLKLIKKYYGEKMMHLCRELFPTILEKEGLLFEILSSKFDYSRFLYDDIIAQEKEENFKNLIYSLANVEKDEKIITGKTPFELMDEAGYTLYECKSEKDIQSFRHYYKRSDGKVLSEYKEGEKPQLYNGEELCTFNGNRLDRCYVFFAVKKNVDEIERKNFTNPERQDEYGTSVISIQFTKDMNNTLSIKNRYNHTVNNPDSTFSNNLDSIIPGLRYSFEREYNFKLKETKTNKFELENYVIANDEKYYKYNYEINNIYYCTNNTVIDHFNVKKYDKERYIVFDYFIIDLVKKTIKIFDKENDDIFLDFKKYKKISIKLNNDDTKTIIINDGIEIIIDKYNRMISYKNESLKIINDNYLKRNYYLESIDLPNVKEIGNFFLQDNRFLKQINIPELEIVKDDILFNNEDLSFINFPKLKKIGNGFIGTNAKIKDISLPSVEEIGAGFLPWDVSLKNISLPNLKTVGDNFIRFNRNIESVNLSNLIVIGNRFLYSNKELKEIDLPNVKEIGTEFLSDNNKIESLSLPEVEIISSSFLVTNEVLKKISLPKVLKISDFFLPANVNLRMIELPCIAYIGDFFLAKDYSLQKVYLPDVETIGKDTFFQLMDGPFISARQARPKIYSPYHPNINTVSLLEYASYEDTCVSQSDIEEMLKYYDKDLKNLDNSEIDNLWLHYNLMKRNEERKIESGSRKL